MPADGFASFLARSLRLLDAEAPQAAALLGRSWAGRTLHLEVDGEALAVRGEQGRLTVSGASSPAAGPHLRTRGAALLALLDGHRTLLSALRSDQLELHGEPGALAELMGALGLYLAGAVRCPSFPALLSQFRAGAAAARSSDERTGPPTALTRS